MIIASSNKSTSAGCMKALPVVNGGTDSLSVTAEDAAKSSTMLECRGSLPTGKSAAISLLRD
jgi:hypothetical protein